MEFNYQNRTIIYDVVYEKRKKTLLTIDPSGFVRIKAPKGTDETLVLAALEQKGPWILEHLDRLDAHYRQQEPETTARFTEGESFFYLGERYPIALVESHDIQKGTVAFDGKVLTVTLPSVDEGAVRDALLKFYGRECRKVIMKRVAFYQPLFKVKPSVVEVRDTPTKWGMCSAERVLTFNWRLVMAPLAALDYVVVHEMCHLVHMNHDRSFWRLVGKILPDHEKRTQWLENHGAQMTL